MENQYGIQAIKSFSESIIDAADTADKVLADGKVNFSDLPQLMGLSGIVSKAQNSKDVVKEALDLTNDEADEVENHIKKYASAKMGNSDNEKIERIAEKTLLAAVALAGVYSEFRD